MDPNPKNFPILSYVMSRIPKLTPKSSTNSDSGEFDIEQPRFSNSGSSKSFKYDEQMMVEMPHLKDPELLASMTLAVSDVSQTRSVLQALGIRPDHESVDAARSKIPEIESELTKKLEEIDLELSSDEQAEKEQECRKAAEKEKSLYKAVIQLDEMHEEYGILLKNAEERLLKIYRSAEAIGKGGSSVVGGGGDGSSSSTTVKEEEEEAEEVNEEVVEILKEASSKGLERVELSGRKLKFLPEAFGKLGGLVSLNLSSNELQVIPDSIAGLQTLEELDLSSNLLESLPDSIGLLLNLRILNVSSNQLNALPDSISHCRSLVELDASYNQLTFLPTKIGHELVNLQKLFIQLNKIRSLPTSVCEMKSLRILDAHFNELRGLPHAIGLLLNLEILNLSSNFSDLTELPESFGDLLNLKELDLSNNQISALPDTFGRLDSLIKLNLEHNPLVIPPMEIVNEGVEAVKEFMVKRWLDILLEAERKCILEANTKAEPGGWLTRSTSWLTNAVSTVSENVTGYLGAGGEKPPSYLDQQY